MPSNIDSIRNFNDLPGLWEVIGFGKVRQCTHFSQETEVEIFLARPNLGRSDRFDASSEIASRFIGCGHLDLVTIGSRWRGGFYEDQVENTAPLEACVSYVKSITMRASVPAGDRPYFPTESFEDAPAYLVRLGDFAEKKFAIIPVMEVVRHTFGVSSGFLRQLFDGIRDGKILPTRPVIDRERSKVESGVCFLRADTPLRDDEARLAAAMLADWRLRRSHDEVSNGLRKSEPWKQGLPTFVVSTMNERWPRPKLGAGVDWDHNLPFEPFCAMNRNELDRVPVSVERLLVVRLGANRVARPVGIDVASELLQAARSVATCSLHEEVEICESACGLIIAACGQFGTNVKAIDCFDEE